MTQTVEKALAAWDMAGAAYRLIAERENRVFRVDHDGRSYALRLHRAGYHSDAELRSELQWMDAVAKGGVLVPAPIAASDGSLLQVIDDIRIDMLTWLGGAPLGKTGTPLEQADRAGVFHAIGQTMARLHQVTDDWTIPEGFKRHAWDRDGLLGEAPFWDRFWDNPTLTAADRTLFTELRETANAHLQRIECDLDYGLIHADLVRENIMLDGDRMQLIDFDDAGFGFRLFDVATTLLKNMSEPDYPDLRDALLAGYHSVRALDTSALDLFMVLRSASYVGWIITRIDEPGSDVRNVRFVETTRGLAQAYLG